MRKKALRRVNIFSLEPGEYELRADHFAIGWVVDNGVQRQDVVEAVLRDAVDSDIRVLAADHDGDAVPVKGSHRVLQTNHEPSDDQVWLGEFLDVFVLREVLISKPSPEVAHVPAPRVALKDLGFGRVRQRLLVQRIRDEFAKSLTHGPVFEDALDSDSEGAVEPQLADSGRCAGGVRVAKHELAERDRAASLASLLRSARRFGQHRAQGCA